MSDLQMQEDIARRCARALGWRSAGVHLCPPWTMWHDSEGKLWNIGRPPSENWRVFFEPCINREHADMLLDDIERRDLWRKFAYRLGDVLDFSPDSCTESVWRCIRATPEQIARAYLLTVEGKGHDA